MLQLTNQITNQITLQLTTKLINQIRNNHAIFIYWGLLDGIKDKLNLLVLGETKLQLVYGVKSVLSTG